MVQTLARITKKGKHFEVLVDLEDALKVKKGEIDFIDVGKIFTDVKKGNHASPSDLEDVFGTSEDMEVAIKIIREGEVQTTQEYRDEEQEKKFKQIVDFLVRNAVDPQTGRPHTTERIKNALEQSHINIKNIPIEQQISDILDKIQKNIPIKIETKKVKIVIPAIHTGKAYGVISQYKETENWHDDGSLEVVVKVPAGIIMDFYDKINSVTHGSVTSEELKQE